MLIIYHNSNSNKNNKKMNISLNTKKGIISKILNFLKKNLNLLFLIH